MIPPSQQPIDAQRSYTDTVGNICAAAVESVRLALSDPNSEESQYLNAEVYNSTAPVGART